MCWLPGLIRPPLRERQVTSPCIFNVPLSTSPWDPYLGQSKTVTSWVERIFTVPVQLAGLLLSTSLVIVQARNPMLEGIAQILDIVGISKVLRQGGDSFDSIGGFVIDVNLQNGSLGSLELVFTVWSFSTNPSIWKTRASSKIFGTNFIGHPGCCNGPSLSRQPQV